VRNIKWQKTISLKTSLDTDSSLRKEKIKIFLWDRER
jgi:hypothetical protein